MSALAARTAFDAADAEARLDWLVASIRQNRFLPVPPPELRFIGDGEFLEVGAEFLRWFVRLGGLAPQERVLDIGCGVGRMAIPLTQYLDTGAYDGMDPSAEGIGWCQRYISTAYPSFRFRHVDLMHPIYNPEGILRTVDTGLPFPDGAFDFVFMTSVLTHLEADEIAAYAREIRRVMAPGARLLLTAFMLNRPAREGLRAGRGALPFDGDAEAPVVHANRKHPTAAIAYDEDFLLSLFLKAGLRRRRPVVYGRWSGRSNPGPAFQDISVLDIDAPSAREQAERA